MRYPAARHTPSYLTGFVGRTVEIARLSELVAEHRIVTVTGPGGVGKTRLAVAVTDELEHRFADGAAFVDLAKVVDDAAVAGAITDAVGIPEQPDVTPLERLVSGVRGRDLLVVTDNCEHVLSGVRSCVAAMIDAGRSLRVLATSRSRLLLTGEVVCPLPGLPSTAASGSPGEAVELLRARAHEAGADPSQIDDDPGAARDLCEALDGLALGIELAAARIPGLGVDGVRRALRDAPDQLAATHVRDERHLSLHTTIDWSYRLLDEDQQRLLRTATVWVAPFTVDALVAISGADATTVAQGLAHLADSSMVVMRPGPPTRYRMPEVIRQFGDDAAREAGEHDEVRRRHREWCDQRLRELLAEPVTDDAWCCRFDAIVEEVGAALSRSVEDGDASASRAALLADGLFRRGSLAGAQARYEQAASLSHDGRRRRELLELAAGSALARYAGSDAVALLADAVDGAVADGDDVAAALTLARIAMIHHRHAGTMSGVDGVRRASAALDRARSLGAGHDGVDLAILVAEATRFDRPDLADRALTRARACGDRLLLHAALDAVTATRLIAGDLAGAAQQVTMRFDPDAELVVDARTAMDALDAQLMGVHVHLAVGDIATARRHADDLAALSFVRQERHVAVARHIEVDALAGRFDAVLVAADRFRDGWERAGRPRVTTFGSAALAVAMVHGLRRDEVARREWIDITGVVMREPTAVDDARLIWPALFAGLVALDCDDLDTAARLLGLAPDELAPACTWAQRLWIPWYAAAWAEAAILTGEDQEATVARAFAATGANEPATLLVDRAAARRARDTASLRRIARRLDRLGCEYQAQRTRTWVAGVVDAPLGALTRREHDVLDLVAAGLTNPQIAARLHISRKTAEHHVSSILTKLGVNSRAAAAALAGGGRLTTGP